MNTGSRRKDQPVKAAVSIIGYALLMSGLGCCIKHISKEVSFEVIVFFRNFFALAFLLIIRETRTRKYRTANRSGWNALLPRTRVFHFHLLRTLFGLMAMYCYFYTLGKIPLAEATLLSYTSPFFVPLFAWVWIREPMSVKTWAAVLLGFLGILLILRPGAGIVNIYALIGVGAGISVAMAAVTIRRMSDTESPGTMVFYFTLISTLASAVPLIWAWKQPTGSQLAWLTVMGVVAVTGQFLMAHGFTLAPAAKVGPFTYFTIFFSAIWGWVIWGEGLDLFFFSGAFLICCSGIFAGRTGRERDT